MFSQRSEAVCFKSDARGPDQAVCVTHWEWGRVGPQLELCTLLFLIIMQGSASHCTVSVPAEPDTRSLKLPFNQPDESAVTQEVARHAYWHLWPSKSSPLFSSRLHLFSFSYSLTSPAVGLSGTDCDTLWHGSRAKLCCASVALPVPGQSNVHQGSVRDPAGWLVSTNCLGRACLPAYVHKCSTQTRLHLLSRNLIGMREAQCDCL